MKATEQLVAFFKLTPHNNPRVASWYNPDMEVQVLVSKGDGEPVVGKNGVYAGNNYLYDWYNFRLPKNANTEPLDNDHNLKYPLDKHVECIGLTGWDWRNKKSIRCGFDYDAITGHAKGVGVDDTQLTVVLNKLLEVPEALVLKSTSGNGLHVYFEFDLQNLPTTNNHTEHAALALACLKEISRRVGFDFQANMDVGGGNMWVWARKTTPENQGFVLLKDNVDENGGRAFLMPPPNWQAYIDVAARRRTKVRIEGVNDTDQEAISEKAAAQRNIPLDDTHKKIIAELQHYSQFTTVWLADHHLLQTHTRCLKMLFDDRAATDDPILGAFETLAEGKDPGKPNVFLFPMKGGAFRACRFGKGTNEHETWKVDKGGWTYCFYNKSLSLNGAAAAFDGLEDDIKGGGYTFPDGPTAIAALRSMGHSIEIPDELENRQVRLQPYKKDKLLVEIVKHTEDKSEPEGWLQKKGKFFKIYNIDTRAHQEINADFEEVDKYVRCLISKDNNTSGWACWHEKGCWVFTSKDDARSRLKAAGYEDNTEVILGDALAKAWTITHVPFQEEFPGDRQWNLKAPTLKYKPEPYEPGDSPHPHWDKVLEHIGADLTANLKDMSWAQRNGITTGKDYLLNWIALMIREPFDHLPYLFLWGNQNTGKSILHQAIGLLMDGGTMRADSALTNQSDFNGELAGAVLCVVEEKNISKNSEAVNDKIKDLVTSDTMAIHAKYKQVVIQPNTTHWIQCSNKKSSCPVFDGDTRVTMIYVDQLVEEIPTPIMHQKLRDEAPYFMYTLMNIALPDIEHRLRLPVVNTSSKEQLIDANKNSLENFIEEHCFVIDGLAVPFDEFYTQFMSSLSATESSYWNRTTILNHLPPHLPLGKLTGGKKYIGNLSLTQPAEVINRPKYITRKGHLILET
jgi:hypothetical protein